MSVVKATGIATQGRQDANQWVTKYIVSYSPDTTNFRYYSEGRGTKASVNLRLRSKNCLVASAGKVRVVSGFDITKTLGPMPQVCTSSMTTKVRAVI